MNLTQFQTEKIFNFYNIEIFEEKFLEETILNNVSC